MILTTFSIIWIIVGFSYFIASVRIGLDVKNSLRKRTWVIIFISCLLFGVPIMLYDMYHRYQQNQDMKRLKKKINEHNETRS